MVIARMILPKAMQSCFSPGNGSFLPILSMLFSFMLFTPSIAYGSESCESHYALHRSGSHDVNLLDKEILDYQRLIEESLVYRTQSIDVAKLIKAKIKNNSPLSGADLEILNEGLIAHLNLRKRLYKVAELHECWIDPRGNLQVSAENRLKGIMLSLSAALTLYDNYLLAISIFEEDSKLRRFLNSEDVGYKKGYAELAAVTLSYNSIENRARVRRVIHYFEERKGELMKPGRSDSLSYLDLLINQSPSYKMTREFAPFRVLKSKLRFLDAITGDTLIGLRSEGINIFSMMFGNTVGLIESRKGKLYKNQAVIERTRKNLKAGDILLEKTPFRLTDKFIPGHWGHAAIWIGTEEELKQLGIWTHPLVRKYHQQIRGGHAVIEALRSGVEMSLLNDFMNIDDLGVLRINRASEKDVSKIILLALRQVGKSYDFNFDVESSDKIVCSELIYTTFTDISWPTENTLGRYTISPDNIAVKTLKNGPLDLVFLVHDGIIIDRQAKLFMAGLLGDVGK